MNPRKLVMTAVALVALGALITVSKRAIADQTYPPTLYDEKSSNYCVQWDLAKEVYNNPTDLQKRSFELINANIPFRARTSATRLGNNALDPIKYDYVIDYCKATKSGAPKGWQF
jgi:hypothetical protein